jgi:U-box domain
MMLKNDIPENFVCPLTLEVMEDPLMNRFGQSYERSAILQWITTKSPTCPLTRQPLKVKDLVPNNRLRKEILEWRSSQGDDVTADLSSDNSDSGIVEEVARALSVLTQSNDFCRKQPRRGLLRLVMRH